jgi:hypothetical protein
MASPDNLKFKGVFREYDSRGYPNYYTVGDVVIFDGQQYVATQNNQATIPTKKSAPWKVLTADYENFYYSDDKPLNADVGDRWVDRLTGRMYTYLEDKNGFHWVEF